MFAVQITECVFVLKSPKNTFSYFLLGPSLRWAGYKNKKFRNKPENSQKWIQKISAEYLKQSLENFSVFSDSVSSAQIRFAFGTCLFSKSGL